MNTEEINRIREQHLSNQWPQYLEAVEISGVHGFLGETIAFNFPVTAIVGENGAGKSTSLRIILDLIRADRGTVRMFGMSYQTHRNEILSRIGCIIEKPDFHGYLSAQTNLELLARVSGAKGNKVDRKRIREMIDFVGLSGREHDHVKGFSHGMKQRLGIAQALMHDPDLILLDEPTSALDPISTAKVEELVHELKNDYTVAIVTHNMQQAARVSDFTAYMYLGELVEFGRTDEIFIKPKKKDTEDYITGRFG